MHYCTCDCSIWKLRTGCKIAVCNCAPCNQNLENGNLTALVYWWYISLQSFTMKSKSTAPNPPPRSCWKIAQKMNYPHYYYYSTHKTWKYTQRWMTMNLLMMLWKKKIMIRMTVTWFFGSELWSTYVLLLTINDYNAITYNNR